MVCRPIRIPPMLALTNHILEVLDKCARRPPAFVQLCQSEWRLAGSDAWPCTMEQYRLASCGFIMPVQRCMQILRLLCVCTAIFLHTLQFPLLQSARDQLKSHHSRRLIQRSHTQGSFKSKHTCSTPQTEAHTQGSSIAHSDSTATPSTLSRAPR